jgi:orotate phosphoribosyltransferase
MDDLLAGGGSILATALQLGEAGLIVRDAVVLLDRQQGGREALRMQGINMVSILTLEVMMNFLMSSGRISEDHYRRTMAFLEAHGHLEEES